MVAILIVMRTVFALEEAQKYGNFLNKKTVVLVNDEIVVDKKLLNDTINIYINKSIDIEQQDDTTVVIQDSL